MNNHRKYLKINLILSFVLLITNLSLAQNFEDKTVDFTVLPVSLISFDATKSNTDVIVVWKTATEYNNSHFVIERSTNGIDFKKVGQVTGAGNSTNINNYYYKDANTPLVNLFYRLQQVDYNGGFNYSPIVVVKNGKNVQPLFSVFPNPIQNRIVNITTGKIDNGKYFFSVKGLDGKTVYNYEQNIIATNQLIKFNLPTRIPTGIYMLQIMNGQGTINETQKIIVQ